MRDPVFEAQFRNMKDSFARQGVQIDVAYQPNGEVDFMYEVDRLLAPNDDDLIDRMARALPGLRRAHIPGQDGPPGDDVVLLAIDDLEGGRMSVPEAVRHLRANIGAADGRPPFSPNHVFHISRTCPAVEPERPCNDEFTPCPPVCTQEPADDEQPEVRIGVSDTGLLQDIAAFPWLAGVAGDLDPLAPGRPGGPPRIPEFTGHGTFIAGVARSMAPRADVFVNNHFSKSGGELENVMIRRLFDLAAAFQPHIINLSAGTYMYGNWAPLALGAFHQKYPDMTLVAAAGNDSTDRPFYPAALDWVVGVGSLASDQVNRAWFSNFGEWVDVYALVSRER
jgi:hypothetical protein